MRLLLDECVPRRLGREFTHHEVYTVRELGWSGKRNGELLRLMSQKGFDVLVTVDQNLPPQQNPSRIGVALLVLVARSNRIRDLRPLVPQALDMLRTIRAGEVRRVGG